MACHQKTWIGLSSLAINLGFDDTKRDQETRRAIVKRLGHRLRTGLRAMRSVKEITFCTAAEDGPQIAGEVRALL
jgi:signal transduction histidine kinase